jgi:hypothetical protein
MSTPTAKRATNAFTKKLGPLPAYAWLGIIAVAILVYRHFQGSTASSTTTPGTTIGTGIGGTGSPDTSGGGGGGTPDVTTPSPIPDVTPPPPVVTDPQTTDNPPPPPATHTPTPDNPTPPHPSPAAHRLARAEKKPTLKPRTIGKIPRYHGSLVVPGLAAPKHAGTVVPSALKRAAASIAAMVAHPVMLTKGRSTPRPAGTGPGGVTGRLVTVGRPRPIPTTVEGFLPVAAAPAKRPKPLQTIARSQGATQPVAVTVSRGRNSSSVPSPARSAAASPPLAPIIGHVTPDNFRSPGNVFGGTPPPPPPHAKPPPPPPPAPSPRKPPPAPPPRARAPHRAPPPPHRTR